MRQPCCWFVYVACLFHVSGSVAQAQVSYAVIDSIYTQDFDSLPTDLPNNASIETVYTDGWRDNTTTVPGTHVSLPGWYLHHPISPASENGFNGNQRLRAGSGANTGAFWLFGSNSSDAEKSLGSIGATTVAGNGANMYIGLHLVNNTDQTLTGFTLTYDGEQWRDGQSPTGETLGFDYNIGASDMNWFLPDTAFVPVASLNFTSPVFAGTGTSGTAVNGNVEGRVTDITGIVSGIMWEPGQSLWLRWGDPQLASNADDGLSIDNVRFSSGLISGNPTDITSVMSGLASSASTWSNNQPPSPTNTYRVLDGHTVTVDAPFQGSELRANSGGTININQSGSGAHIPLLIIDAGGNLTESASGSFFLGDIFAPALGNLHLNSDVSFTIDPAADFGLDMRLQGTGSIDFNTGAGSRLILSDAASHGGTIRFNGTGDQVRLTEVTSGGFGTLEMNSTGANMLYYNPGAQADEGRVIFNQPGTIDHAASSTSPLRRLHGPRFLEANAPVTIDVSRGFPDDSTQTEERRFQIAGTASVAGLSGSADITVIGTAVDYSNSSGISLNEFETGATGEPSAAPPTSAYSGTMTFNNYLNAEIRQHHPNARFVVNNNARLEMGHQTLSANHSIQMGEVVVNGGGILEVGFEQTSSSGVPGHHAYTLTLTSAGSRDGSLTLNSGANLRMQINGLATNEFDRVLAEGDVQLSGTLQVLVNPDASSGGTGTTPNPHWTPSIGDKFDIIQAVAAALEGDFNSDGAVDAADYVIWRKNAGTQDEYNQWRTNFGAMGGASGQINGTFDSVLVQDFDGAMSGFNFKVNYSPTAVQLEVIAAGAGAASAVPEPSSVALAGLLLSMLTMARRRRTP